MYQWKQFENRSIFGKDMDRTLWLTFWAILYVRRDCFKRPFNTDFSAPMTTASEPEGMLVENSAWMRCTFRSLFSHGIPWDLAGVYANNFRDVDDSSSFVKYSFACISFNAINLLLLTSSSLRLSCHVKMTRQCTDAHYGLFFIAIHSAWHTWMNVLHSCIAFGFYRSQCCCT